MSVAPPPLHRIDPRVRLLACVVATVIVLFLAAR
jgi:hypothetical protein